MSGLGTIAEALSIQLGRLALFEEEDDRRGRRIAGESGGRSGGTGIRNSLGYDDDLPKRGGGRRISNSSGGNRFFAAAKAGPRGSAGPQAAVIKVASYAAGRRRVGALTDYLSRDGTLQVENQSGQKLTGRSVLDAELVTWENAFENRAPSKDVASLVIGVGAASDKQLADGLEQAFAGRKFVWQRVEDDTSSVRVVVVLAGQDRRRLDVSAAGLRKMTETLTNVWGADAEKVTAALTSTGHGKDGLGYRLARLAGKGAFETSEGQTIGTRAEASALARDWSKGLNSRRVRDTMHLVMSAKAGTELAAFEKTTRAFLAERFEGHRFLFALHQDRQHVHAHAVITMRRDDGIKLDPKIKDLAAWRETFSEQARAHGIDMVATRRLERAAAPAYKLKDVQLVEAAARDGVTPPQKAKLRVEAKQYDAIHVPSRAEGKAAVAMARATSTNIEDRERLAIADVTAKFLDQLQATWGGDNAKEANMAQRPVDELQSDLKQMNAAATRIALLLPAASRPQFHALANPILENAALVVDQAMSVAAVDGLSSQANDVARQERREATEARQLADLASRAAEPLRRNEVPGSTERVEIEAIARSAERTAAREQREAIAATQVAQAVTCGEPIPVQANEPEAVQKLREEQARLLREQAKARSRERGRDQEDEL
ncbi:MAG: relaxase/mobilization nuclease domain-containing protein [Bosea sp. (in: a-proteobacteria)]